MALIFTPTDIPEVIMITPVVYGDNRGFFMETWQKTLFQKAGINVNFVQDNHSSSSRGILRGLHYQLKQPQGKLVRVIVGEVFDVAVDLRTSSPTFGKWIGTTLSAENKKMLWVPPGFAHGFLVISNYAEFMYKCTDFYAPHHERSIRWDDPDLAINWPLITKEQPVLSEKDAAGVQFKEAEYYD